MTSGTLFTAKRKTSRPSMRINSSGWMDAWSTCDCIGRTSAIFPCGSWPAREAAGFCPAFFSSAQPFRWRLIRVSAGPAAPSECITGEGSSPGSALSTAAPAPSPNRIQVPRSFQFTILDRLSEPISRAVLHKPAAIYACAVLYANKNPVQAAFRSKQAAWTAPSSFCTSQAAQGSSTSEVNVHTINRSISSGCTFPFSNARLAASAAMDTVVSSSMICLLATPVRSRIQASLVSTI